MTPNIEKRQFKTRNNNQQLTLVYSASRALDQLLNFTFVEATKPVNQRTISQITHALMCWLWIPHTSAIVGLLGVGLASSNFEALSKWVAQELRSMTSKDAQDAFQVFERRFRNTVDQFPEV